MTERRVSIRRWLFRAAVVLAVLFCIAVATTVLENRRYLWWRVYDAKVFFGPTAARSTVVYRNGESVLVAFPCPGGAPGVFSYWGYVLNEGDRAVSDCGAASILNTASVLEDFYLTPVVAFAEKLPPGETPLGSFVLDERSRSRTGSYIITFSDDYGKPVRVEMK